MPSHPYTGKARLTLGAPVNGVWSVYIERDAKYRRGQGYTVRENFALIRPAYGAGALHDATRGFVVTRNSFDEIREFDTFDEAMTYVDALFALETGD